MKRWTIDASPGKWLSPKTQKKASIDRKLVSSNSFRFGRSSPRSIAALEADQDLKYHSEELIVSNVDREDGAKPRHHYEMGKIAAPAAKSGPIRIFGKSITRPQKGKRSTSLGIQTKNAPSIDRRLGLQRAKSSRRTITEKNSSSPVRERDISEFFRHKATTTTKPKDGAESKARSSVASEVMTMADDNESFVTDHCWDDGTFASGLSSINPPSSKQSKKKKTDALFLSSNKKKDFVRYSGNNLDQDQAGDDEFGAVLRNDEFVNKQHQQQQQHQQHQQQQAFPPPLLGRRRSSTSTTQPDLVFLWGDAYMTPESVLLSFQRKNGALVDLTMAEMEDHLFRPDCNTTMADIVDHLESKESTLLFNDAVGEKSLVFTVVSCNGARFYPQEFRRMTLTEVIRFTDQRPICVEIETEDLDLFANFDDDASTNTLEIF